MPVCGYRRLIHEAHQFHDRLPSVPLGERRGRLMIDVRIAPATAGNTKLASQLAALVNSVYAVAEEGLWADGTPRTTPAEMARLIAAGQIAVARTGEGVVGAV